MGWTLIQSQVLGSTSATITFSSIPQTYKTLAVLYSLRDNQSQVYANASVIFNGSTSGYSGRVLQGNGSTIGSANVSGGSSMGYMDGAGANATASVFGNGCLTIPNYAGSSIKVIANDSVTENNATAGYQTITGYLWNNTAAITSLTIQTIGFVFQANSSVTLYGIS